MELNCDETGLEIAIIGMAGRFPGAGNIHEFWKNLIQGVESISFFSDEELTGEEIETSMLDNPNYVKAKGVLEDIEYFDASFFGLSPREAEVMDPQLRIFLENSWQALEDAGYNPETYNGLIGLYAGNAVNYHWVARALFSGKMDQVGGYRVEMLNAHFCTRVSYHLNLTGPVFTVQSACSTSLVSIHLACMALLSSECDMALAGGVSVSIPSKSGYLYQEGVVVSDDGHCRAFDVDASGTVFGEGVAVVVLKRLHEAQRAGDYIYAVIKGTAVNNDGTRKVGYTAPSIEGQASVIQSAYMAGEVKPETISYIEAHGTATPLGDPVEIAALHMVFNSIKKGSIAIGSVKTNIGHLNTAAGSAGFIKTVLMLKHHLIPPSLHFNALNPKINFENSPFYVNTGLKEWKSDKYPLRAGVSSFGIGGTNAHVVLEEWPMAQSENRMVHGAWSQARGGVYPLFQSRDYQLILLSARTPSALERMTGNLASHFKNNTGTNLADAAYTLQVGRKSFPHRRMSLCATINEALEGLSKNSKKVKTAFTKKDNPPVVFMLPGQGPQYTNMGYDLYQKEPLFQKEIDLCFEILESLPGEDIKKILYPSSLSSGISAVANYKPAAHGPRLTISSGEINQPEIAQVVIFIFAYALGRLLMKWGINPTAVVGYSLGEYTAACLSGVFSLPDALKLVTRRGQLMRKTRPGGMLSVPLTEMELKPLLPGDGSVTLAIVNGPSCIVAGTSAALEAFEQRMRKKRLLCMLINIGHAVHSPLMETIREELVGAAAAVSLNKPQIPYISNVTGDWISLEEATDPGYWGDHLCSPVRFSDGLTRLLEAENTVFLEIGPGRMLSNLVRQHHHKGPAQMVFNLVKQQREKAADDYFLLSKIGEMWLYGVRPDWQAIAAREKPRRLPLPIYPFEGQYYWLPAFSPGGKSGFLSAGAPAEDEKPAKKTGPPDTVFQVKPGSDFLPGNEEVPANPLEKVIARVWVDLLGCDYPGIHQDFFELNGDSLTASQMISRLQQEYPVEISLRRFLENPTIEHLAKIIEKLLIEKVSNLSEEEIEKFEG
jgi:acyl transferase domain-containing protein